MSDQADWSLVLCMDLETTHKVPYFAEPIEMGACILYWNEKTNEWKKPTTAYQYKQSTLVKPRGRIPADITNLTHLSDDDVRDAPSFPVVWHMAEKCIQALRLWPKQEVIWVGHNCKYDLVVMACSFERYAQECKETFAAACSRLRIHYMMDTLVWMQRKFAKGARLDAFTAGLFGNRQEPPPNRRLSSHQLEDVYTFLTGKTRPNKHRALSDAQTVLFLIQGLVDWRDGVSCMETTLDQIGKTKTKTRVFSFFFLIVILCRFATNRTTICSLLSKKGHSTS
jgi:DNA polymerase III epsilon subunit-like protein